MSKKVFISYSLKDETHKDALDEHLAMLKRSKVIAAWHDRKISPGQDWSKEISEHLEDSELILFLISPSFLSSDYCFNVEMSRAIAMHDTGKAQLIPIVVRPCDWALSGLSKFQAVPKDAKPITTWTNTDEAWLDAVHGIKSHLESFKPTRPVTLEIKKEGEIKVSDSTLEWIEDTEVALTHRKFDKVKLSDVYVSLDMESDEIERSEIDICSSDIMFTEPARYLVYGEEQQGKSSLLKYVFRKFLNLEAAPIYLNARDINQSDISKSLSIALKEQYNGLGLEEFMAMPIIVLLIDDLDHIGLNSRYRATFLASVNESFSAVVITCHSSFNYVLPEILELNQFKRFELLGLGHIKRAEIVEKWVSLGVRESIGEHALYDQCDELKARLDTVIRKIVVPSKPKFILMLLQMFEAYAQQNLDLSSHGHCYQQLIYQAFDHAKIPKNEIDKYLNVLTELAWVLHKNGGSINQHQLETFFKEYEKSYLPVDGNAVVKKLKSNSILAEKDFGIKFKYPYLFYFFTAKKIAEAYSTDPNVQEEVRKLVSDLHREDYANILVFVTHHTKEAWVLIEIQKALNSLFDDLSPATLSIDQLEYIDEFIAQIPDLVMEQREIKKKKQKHKKHLDEAERHDIEIHFETDAPIDILANINKTFKGMEISGQIIRNRHATLKRDAIFDLASSGAFTGLKNKKNNKKNTKTTKQKEKKTKKQKLKEHPNLTNKEVQDHAKDAFLLMTYGVISGVIRKIASSIGSREADEIYKKIEEGSSSPALLLVNQAIELHFKRSLDTQSVATTALKLKNNSVCTRILKEMVIQHTYMFPVQYKEKQQLAELLSIPIQAQRLMDRKKIGKA